MKKLLGLLASAPGALVKLIQYVFGEVHWKAPPWPLRLSRLVRRTAALRADQVLKFRREKPKQFLLISFSSLLVLAVLGAAVRWYVHLPAPSYVTVSANEIAPTPVDVKEALPMPLTLTFSASAAPLNEIGKEVRQGISIRPEVSGVWKWAAADQLVFTPAKDWEVAVEYQIRLDKNLVAPHVRLRDYTLDFASPRFRIENLGSEFYEDPADPKNKRAILNLKFSHPVDKSSLEKRVSIEEGVLSAENRRVTKTQLDFKITYAENGGKAFLQSSPVRIPPKDSRIAFRIETGVRSERGGNGSDGPVTGTVTIPGIEKYFRIESISEKITTDDRYEPQRVISVESSVGISQGEAEKRISAVLLPIDRPGLGDRTHQKRYRWSSILEVTPDVIAQSEPVQLRFLPSEREFSPIINFSYSAPAGRYLLVRVEQGTRSFGDFALNRPIWEIVPVAELPRMVKIMHEGSLLSITGDRKLSIVTRNLQAVKFTLSRVLPTSLQHLLTQTWPESRFQLPRFNTHFGIENISEVFTEVRLVNNSSPSSPRYSAFDFEPYLAAQPAAPRGLFMLRAEGWAPQENRSLNEYDQRLVLVTDMGVLIKDARDGTHLVFVQSLRSGLAVGGAQVQVIGKNGLAVLSAVTSTEGEAALPSLKDFVREKEPVGYVVTFQDDLSFVPYNRRDRILNFSRFDTGGLQYSKETESLQAYLFSDRGIYRPGEEARITLIVKRTDWAPLPPGIPLELVITDPRGVEVRREAISFDADGLREYAFPTRYGSPTGSYQAALYLSRKDQSERRVPVFLAATRLRVEEFLPDRLRIMARLTPERSEGWISPDALRARVTLSNLFGTAAASHGVKGSLTLSPAMPAFAAYRDFSFFDPALAKNSFDEDLGEVKTDGKGEAEFDLRLGRFEKGTYRLNFVAEGFELEGGRSVSSDVSAIVSPLTHLVGYKADGGLAYLKRGAVRRVNLIAIGPDLRPVGLPDLKAQLIEATYVSVLAKQENGNLAYQSVKKEVPRSELGMTIGEGGASVPLDTSAPGTFALVIRDRAGTELNRIVYTVVGDANVSRDVERNAELKIKLDKQDYAPGEEIEVAVSAPYTGAGLITIERDKVYGFKWFRSSTTSFVERIRLPEGLEGNGYVNVSFVRGLDSKEIYMSPLSYGVEPFSISRQRRTLKIPLSVPDVLRPGDRLRIGYRADRPSRAVLFAVDEGILQVARYKRPDPLSQFFQKRALETETRQILDLLLPEYHILREVLSTGGDQDALNRRLNPFKRKNEKPVAFWSGIVEAGPEERFVEYQVPDYFNGTVRITAVAVSEEAIGVSEEKTVVRGDYVMAPSAPLFAAPGDEFTVVTSVSNNLKGIEARAPIEAELEVDRRLEIIDSMAAQKIEIPEGRETSVRWRVRAKKDLGASAMKFKVGGAGRTASYTLELSIRPSTPFSTDVRSGYVMKGILNDGVAEIPVTRRMFPHYRTREATVSNLPFVFVRGLMQYLIHYPHGCSEQVTSQAFPSLVVGSWRDLGFDDAKSLEAIDRAIALLQARQNAGGGFGFWDSASPASDFHSVYAAHFLLEARERGYNVPASLFRRALDFVKSVASREGRLGRPLGEESEEFESEEVAPLSESYEYLDPLASLRARAYAIYVLSRNGLTATNYLTALRQDAEREFKDRWVRDLTGLYAAGAYQLLKLDRQADELASRADMKAAPATSRRGSFYDPLLYRATILYIFSRHFPERARELGAGAIQALADEMVAGRFNTISSAFSILALDAYSRLNGPVRTADVSGAEIQADGSSHALPLCDKAYCSLDLSDRASAVRLEAPKGGDLFYQVTEAGFDLEPPPGERRDMLEVAREYRDVKGDPITSAHLGDTVTAVVSIRSLGNEAIPYVAVEDLIPSGLEVDIRPEALGDRRSAGSTDDTWVPDYIDVREDRVVFYGMATGEARRFSYHLKASSRGAFVVPPIQADSMYERNIRARSAGGTFRIED